MMRNCHTDKQSMGYFVCGCDDYEKYYTTNCVVLCCVRRGFGRVGTANVF